MARAAPDETPKLGEEVTGNDVFDEDGETVNGVEICCGSSEPITQSELLYRLGRRLRSDLGTAADDATPEYVALQVNASAAA